MQAHVSEQNTPSRWYYNKQNDISIELRVLLTWLTQTNKRNANFSFRKLKINELNELIWLIKLKACTVKYQSLGFPWYAAHEGHDFSWHVATELSGTWHSPTRYLSGHVTFWCRVGGVSGNFTVKLLISRSAFWYLCAMRVKMRYWYIYTMHKRKALMR